MFCIRQEALAVSQGWFLKTMVAKLVRLQVRAEGSYHANIQIIKVLGHGVGDARKQCQRNYEWVKSWSKLLP